MQTHLLFIGPSIILKPQPKASTLHNPELGCPQTGGLATYE